MFPSFQAEPAGALEDEPMAAQHLIGGQFDSSHTDPSIRQLLVDAGLEGRSDLLRLGPQPGAHQREVGEERLANDRTLVEPDLLHPKLV